MASVSKVSAATKPLLSQSSAEARRRVLNLYRAWYREVIEIGLNFVIVSLCTALYNSNKERAENVQYQYLCKIKDTGFYSCTVSNLVMYFLILNWLLKFLIVINQNRLLVGPDLTILILEWPLGHFG